MRSPLAAFLLRCKPNKAYAKSIWTVFEDVIFTTISFGLVDKLIFRGTSYVVHGFSLVARSFLYGWYLRLGINWLCYIDSV